MVERLTSRDCMYSRTLDYFIWARWMAAMPSIVCRRIVGESIKGLFDFFFKILSEAGGW
jgi:hypothetical protein